MLLHDERLPPIDCDTLVGWILQQAAEEPVSVGNFYIIDVNDHSEYEKCHVVGAYFYDRLLLSRLVFETPVLKQASTTRTTLVIYGRESERVSNVLFQRGWRTIYLTGNIDLFKEKYPALVDKNFDIDQLREQHDRKRNNVYGGRLWRSASASRVSTAERKNSREKSARPKPKRVLSASVSTKQLDRPPWKPWHS
ncbi:unnamed protein product [Caenorhabditis auriculariae]|uniref:Rhodanese domain-containing protein n=1 Tax=Caenorhabditis auriculariae TaxID=2777116 RepID=A0A8S1H8T1_9PELO|nr:unnamed protein product [Caenorhabditis auriculariae]